MKKLNHTHLVLIPKMTSPRNMTQLRLISLCNVIYKVIAKLITNRMKNVLPHIISTNQSAFVAGRQIQDNILVVREILHSLNQVEWSFLLEIMKAFGFPNDFVFELQNA